MTARLDPAAHTLLVVEDDESIRNMEVMVFRRLGHTVLEADGSEEAMRLAKVAPTIHLLLTDYSMPGANGLELVEQLRAVHPHTPVLMVSGSLDAIARTARLPDRFAILAKPFTLDHLVDHAHALLSGEYPPLPAWVTERSRPGPTGVRDPIASEPGLRRQSPIPDTGNNLLTPQTGRRNVEL